MTTEQYQRPEGRLLADAIKAKGISVRQIAKTMDISDTRLRHIINGYQPVKGEQALKVIGPPDTIARAARVLDLSPEALESVGRHDAAQSLRRQLRVVPDLGRLIPEPAGDDTTAEILRRLDRIDERLDELESRVPAPRPNLAGVAFEDEREGHTDFD